MPATASQLRDTIQSFTGGSAQRYRHALNPAFTYTGGMKAVADQANAHWLVDEIALALAPEFARAWLAGKASVGSITLRVEENGQATLVLEMEDGKPPSVTTRLALTDFPVGEWTFLLATDEDEAGGYLTNCLLPSEY